MKNIAKGKLTMMHPSTMKLVDRLCAMTSQGKIEWTHGEEPGILLYDTEGYRVILQGEPTNIQLTDTSGQELEKVDAAELAQTAHPDVGTYDIAVAALLTDAKRIARGTESAINSVLEGLDLDGDGIVDIPMEDGLVPSAAEIADPAPDVVEDAADETGIATLAEADVADVSSAVASLADQVNQTENQQVTSEISNQEGRHTALNSDDDSGHAGAAAITGLTAAGLGAAGLVKAARHNLTPTEPEVLAEASEAAPRLPTEVQQTENFDLTQASNTEAAPLQLTPQQDVPAPQAEEALTEAAASTDFVPPQPGQTLSLSGLTKGKHQDIPIMAGTATTLPSINEPDLTLNVPEAIEPPPVAEEIPAAPKAPPPPEAVNVPVQTESAAPTPAPQAEPEPEAPAKAPSSSRFNPWI